MPYLSSIVQNFGFSLIGSTEHQNSWWCATGTRCKTDHHEHSGHTAWDKMQVVQKTSLNVSSAPPNLGSCALSLQYCPLSEINSFLPCIHLLDSSFPFPLMPNGYMFNQSPDPATHNPVLKPVASLSCDGVMLAHQLGITTSRGICTILHIGFQLQQEFLFCVGLCSP